MFFDRIDIAEAYYMFFCHCHEGQASEKYRRLSRIARHFKPRPSLSVETLSENGREIYEALIQKEEARILCSLVARHSLPVGPSMSELRTDLAS